MLDFGGASRLLLLNLPAGSRLALQRMVLTGLGAASAVTGGRAAPAGATELSLLGNMTSLLWATDFSRRQPMLRLTNVTMLVAPPELAVLQAALSAVPDPGAAPAIDSGVVSLVYNTWALSNVLSSNATSLVLANLGTAGVDGSAVSLSTFAPPGVYSLSPAYTFNATDAVALAYAAPPAPAVNEGGSSALPKWAIGVIAAGCGVLVVGVALFAWFWQRRVKRLKKEVDVERAAKSRALEQVEAIMSQRNTPSDMSQVCCTSTPVRT